MFDGVGGGFGDGVEGGDFDVAVVSGGGSGDGDGDGGGGGHGADGGFEAFGFEEGWVEAGGEGVDLVDGSLGFGGELGEEVGGASGAFGVGGACGEGDRDFESEDVLDGSLLELTFEASQFGVLGVDEAATG